MIRNMNFIAVDSLLQLSINYFGIDHLPDIFHVRRRYHLINKLQFLSNESIIYHSTAQGLCFCEYFRKTYVFQYCHCTDDQFLCSVFGSQVLNVLKGRTFFDAFSTTVNGIFQIDT
eukprot:Lithocolla_globosa_v1_NODE_10160_length_629_cov_1899.644599.p1 type:complete len:116 gc:universal NODE_10160_length_629_cov_1899.644599:124-471(+)